MDYGNAWLKRSIFNLDLNWESESEPETYQEEPNTKTLSLLQCTYILGTTKSPEICDLKEPDGL